MREQDLQFFKDWFNRYTESFYFTDHEDQKNILTKITHTGKVCENIVDIVKGSDLDGEVLLLAETVALFHDIGRFSQYKRYKTYMDKKSISHGLLGSRVLIEEGILESLSEKEQQIILDTVKYHGSFDIPTVFDDERAFYLKLVRDADKLDIFRVFINYYESPESERASATAFGLKNTPGYSAEVISSIFNNRTASYSALKNENDFRLLKLSWIFGINFSATLKLLTERGYLDNLVQKLPQTHELLSAVAHIREYIDTRIRTGDL